MFQNVLLYLVKVNEVVYYEVCICPKEKFYSIYFIRLWIIEECFVFYTRISQSNIEYMIVGPIVLYS